MKKKIDKTFIIHLKSLSDRKKYLDQEIVNKYGFENFEYVISDSESDNNILQNNSYIYKPELYNKLTNPEICNYEVQLRVWKKIVSCGFNNVLIVEDDIIFKENYNFFIKDMIENLPDDYDICFLSECCSLYPQNQNDSLFVESNTSRCCVAYIISGKACKKLINIKNFYFPVDHHLNYIKNYLNLKYYWSDPTIFDQGSGVVYKSNANRNR